MPFISDPSLKRLADTQQRVGGFQADTSLQSSPLAAPQQKDFFGRVGDIITRRSENVGDIADVTNVPFKSRGRGQSFLEGILQVAGQGIAGTGEVAFEAVSSLIPKPVKKLAGQGAQEVLKTPLGQAGLKALGEGIEAYQEFKKKNPRAARDLEAVVNISEIIPAVKGAALTARGARAGATSLRRSLEKQVSKEALDVVNPSFTKKEAERALAAGRGRLEGGLFKTTRVAPSRQDISAAAVVQDVVKKSNHPVENIAAIRSKITSESRKVGRHLEANPSPFNESQVRFKLNQLKDGSRVVFSGDAALERSYDAVIEEMVRIMSKKKKTLGDLWQARKEFDTTMERKFPNVFDKFSGDSARANAILDVRRGVNDFISDRLPEGNPFKDKLREISLMYHATDNIAGKAAKLVDQDVVKRALRFMRANPVVVGVTGGILTFGALAGLLTNPVAIGGLILGGSFKIGKKVITSKTVKKALTKALDATGKTGVPIFPFEGGRRAVEQLRDSLPD